MRPIRLAVVDDSSFVRKALERMLRDENRVEVVGTAVSGEELLANLEDWDPDVITLDLSMPGIGGLVTLDRVMAIRPTPVIILSTHAGKGAPQTIEALHRGAADFIDKQRYSLLDFSALREVLVEKIVAVTRRQEGIEPGRRPKTLPSEAGPPAESRVVEMGEVSPFELLLIGASTGGPPAIERLLGDLGERCPVPVVIVQHMPVGFTRAFAERLNVHLPLEVHEVRDRDVLHSNRVYIAPAGHHVRVTREGGRLIGRLSLEPEDSTHRPSVDELFRSARESLGPRIAAVLLTGMGRDGAEGLAALAGAGAYTVAQQEASCVVYGMPRAAVSLGGAREILPLEEIGPRIRGLFEGLGERAVSS
ncbi:MAG: chemotaxis-specific protein-glutamate methyltransferase CheB [Thermoanaerobaculia bacterium]|nr:chemotaxis-specific protein-glutamate methyltransferase CheB [Thermoanaerobaculia bacterium]